MARSGDVIEHPVTGERITFLATAEDTGGEYLRMELRAAPGGFVPGGLHLHPHQTERFQVLEGTLRFVVGGEESDLGPGQEVTVPAGTPHAWRNPSGAGEIVAILEFRPALNAEEVFESAFGLAQDGKVDPRTGVPDQPWLALIVVHYHDVAHGAEPPLDVLLDLMRPIAEDAERDGYQLPYPYPYARVREARDAGEKIAG